MEDGRGFIGSLAGIGCSDHLGSLRSASTIAEARVAALSKDGSGRTLLHHAVEKAHTDCVSVLLSAGADVSACDNEGRQAIHFAARAGCMTDTLLAAGANPNARMFCSKMPLHYAAQHGHPECIQQLVEAGADMNEGGRRGSTPIHFAVANERVDSVRVLIELGADLREKDKDGRTPLALAAEMSQTVSVSDLIVIAGGADFVKSRNIIAIFSLLLDRDAESKRSLFSKVIEKTGNIDLIEIKGC